MNTSRRLTKAISCSVTSASVTCPVCLNCALPSMKTRTRTRSITRISRPPFPCLATKSTWRSGSWRTWRTWTRCYRSKLWPWGLWASEKKLQHRTKLVQRPYSTGRGNKKRHSRCCRSRSSSPITSLTTRKKKSLKRSSWTASENTWTSIRATGLTLNCRTRAWTN